MKPAASTSIGASLCAFAAQAPHAAQVPAAEQRSLPGPRRAIREVPGTASPRLTVRQLEVLALLCEGLPNKLICRRLDIAVGTVKIHVSCILRELGATTRLQAVVAANRLGLLNGRAVEQPAAAGTDLAIGVTSRPVPAARYHDAVAF